MLAQTLMIQGTASNVGKSVVAAALCRIFKRRGYRVAPFKAQNMSNNSFVTTDGGEIGRAQAVQAQACGIEPSVLMNPVLLKPTSDHRAQVVVLGKVSAILSAKEYQDYKTQLIPIVNDSLERLRQDFDIIIIEGAGSPAEINLKNSDIVNMRVAKAVNSPVILVGDIDKGGVFAQIVGTFDLLEPQEQDLVKGFVINKFRGDKDVLTDGVEWIEQRIRRKSFGVLPFIRDLNIEQEDSVVLDEALSESQATQTSADQLLVQVIKLPRISNFTDFEPLSREKDVTLQYIKEPTRHCVPDLLIIPGTKATTADLEYLKTSGFAAYIQRCARLGVSILGVCGGYQMLGESILDPSGVESSVQECECKGLGLLPIKTIFHKQKQTVQVKAVHVESQLAVTGYEIHMGATQVFDLDKAKPLFKIVKRHDEMVEDHEGIVVNQKNALGTNTLIYGTYLHGLFDSSEFRRYFLDKIWTMVGMTSVRKISKDDIHSTVCVYDELADQLEPHLDMAAIESLVGGILV